jgi:hypothetical protein
MARGSDAVWANPALLRLSDQPRASTSLFGISGNPAILEGFARSDLGRAWRTNGPSEWSTSEQRGLRRLAANGAGPGADLTTIEWLGGHSGGTGFGVRSQAIQSWAPSERFRRALSGDAGVLSQATSGPTGRTGLLSTGALAIGQQRGNVTMGRVRWSGIRVQATRIHEWTEWQDGTIRNDVAAGQGFLLPTGDLPGSAQLSRLDHLRINQGWVWSGGAGMALMTSERVMLTGALDHIVQFTRVKDAEVEAGTTIFGLPPVGGEPLGRDGASRVVTAADTEVLRAQAQALANAARWRPTASVGLAMLRPVAGLRRIHLAATFPLDRKPSFVATGRGYAIAVEPTTPFLPVMGFRHDDERGDLAHAVWRVRGCSLGVDLGGSAAWTAATAVQWSMMVRFVATPNRCTLSLGD